MRVKCQWRKPHITFACTEREGLSKSIAGVK